MLSVNILFPVLNEEKRLEAGITQTSLYLEQKLKIPYTLTIIDNGSSDRTPEISENLCKRLPHVAYIRTYEKGVGVAFQAGIKENTADIVGYMDVDLSTDINHLADMYEIFNKDPNVEIVNASRWNKKSHTTGRKWYRNLTSYGLITLIKIMFNVKTTDVICGFKFFKKDTVEKLVRSTQRDNGWFYIIEMIIRAEQAGMKMYELPVRWKDDYNTTVHVRSLTAYYLKNLIRLKLQKG